MPYCQNCGTKNEEGAKFCENCGTRLMLTPSVPGWETEDRTRERGAGEPPKGTGGPVPAESYPQGQGGGEPPKGAGGPVPAGPAREGREEGPLRPSQMRKARQQNQSGSTITLRKPTVNIDQVKARTKRLTKTQILVIAEAVCLVALICLFVGIGSSRSSARAAAERYVRAYMDQDWDAVYDLVDYPEGPLLQKDLFVEMMESETHPEITSYEVIPMDEEGSGIQKSFIARYTVRGQGSEDMRLDLLKQGKKSMLFFDTWKVSAFESVAQDVWVSVPAGAEVTVDGVALTQEDLGNDGEAYVDGLDSYCLTLFAGPHKLQAAVPWFNLYEAEFDAVSGNSVYVDEMELSEEGKQAIEVKMQEALERIYQAGMDEKDFSEISDLFLAEYQGECKARYEEFVSDLHSSEYYTLNQATFHDFRPEIYGYAGGSYSGGSDGKIGGQMTFDYQIQYTYTYRSWSGTVSQPESRTDQGYSNIYVYFDYDGETYKIMNFDLYSVL